MYLRDVFNKKFPRLNISIVSIKHCGIIEIQKRFIQNTPSLESESCRRLYID